MGGGASLLRGGFSNLPTGSSADVCLCRWLHPSWASGSSRSSRVGSRGVRLHGPASCTGVRGRSIVLDRCTTIRRYRSRRLTANIWIASWRNCFVGGSAHWLSCDVCWVRSNAILIRTADRASLDIRTCRRHSSRTWTTSNHIGGSCGRHHRSPHRSAASHRLSGDWRSNYRSSKDGRVWPTGTKRPRSRK